jgi:hypothetical protein
MRDVHAAHRQIRSWLQQHPGVLASEVVGPLGGEAIVITYTADLSADDREEIADRLRGYPVRFEFGPRPP